MKTLIVSVVAFSILVVALIGVIAWIVKDHRKGRRRF